MSSLLDGVAFPVDQFNYLESLLVINVGVFFDSSIFSHFLSPSNDFYENYIDIKVFWQFQRQNKYWKMNNRAINQLRVHETREKTFFEANFFNDLISLKFK